MKRVVSQSLDETNFTRTYPEVVLPWFDGARTTGRLTAADGRSLSWNKIEVPNERGALVIVPGFTELAESYAELLYDLRDTGYSFYLLDHRGQGLSEGDYPTHERWHIEDWRSFVSDLSLFFEEVVQAKSHPTTIVCASSMGGAIATVYLAEHPAAAEGLILVAPMYRIVTSPIPLFAMTAFACIMIAFGEGSSYMPGYGPYETAPFEGNTWKVSSRVRYEAIQRLEHSNPLYEMGGPTAKGGLALVRLSKAGLKAAANVTVPTLLIQAEKDHVVGNRAQDRAAKSMKSCRTLVIPDANHILMLERDEIRSGAVEAVGAFLAEAAGAE